MAAMASSDDETTGQPDAAWSEESSAHFIERGRVYTPARDAIQEAILGLIPAAAADPFLAVELGIGAGWLSAAILERFSAARVLGLDGSPAMLHESEARLGAFAGRFELRTFRLEDRAWQAGIEGDVRCFVSSLVIHHLDAEGKRALYGDLYARLADGGAVLIADLVAPRSEWERRYLARQWDAEVRRQSLEMTGSLATYQQFVDDQWNWYEYPDPLDMPATVPEHLNWLAEAGFVGVNVFWERAGHAVYGGYKPS
jgi:tRNA (cmo5U34)-methyltransferase